jgi:class 3 adenylate cyclase/CHASE2 domain-containing sensor protein
MEWLKKIGKSLLVGTVAGVLIALITNYFVPALIDRLENQSYYMRYLWKYMDTDKNEDKNQAPESSICIVDIDDVTQIKMGVYWSWNRSYHAQLINNLDKQFPGAIVFDILFHDPEDSNHIRRIEKLLEYNRRLHPHSRLTAAQEQSLLSSVDYDRQFIEATAASGKVFHGLRLSDERDYVSLSTVEQRKTMQWHESLHPSSALRLPPELFRDIPNKDYLDGIFPPLAQASRDIGHVNIMHNKDGIIREVELLYRFNNNPIAYLPLSVRTMATLFGTPNEEIRFVPGRYLDIGTPFKIGKDSLGRIRCSYPNMTPAQLRAIIEQAPAILASTQDKGATISTFLKMCRGDSGALSLVMYSGTYPAPVVEALRRASLDSIIALPVGGAIRMGPEIAMSRTSDVDWMLTAPFGEEEWAIPETELKTLRRFDWSGMDSLAPGSEKLAFYTVDVRRTNGVLTSSIPVLRGKTLQDLCGITWKTIEEMKPGSRMEFGDNVRIPLTPDNKHIVTYFGPKKTVFKYIPYYKIYRNDVRGGLDGKIFLVGSSVPSMFDIVSVPLDQDYPGVEVHASLMNSILTNTFITRLGAWNDLIILLLVGVFIGFIGFMLKPLPGMLLTAASVVGYFLIALGVFGTQNLWIPIARPVITIILTYTAVMVYRYITEEKDRKFLQNTFKAYLSPELIDIMYKERQMPQLGGEEGIRTAFFTDIQGFSTFSEKLGSPTRLVELLNEYLTVMTDILLAHYGTLDKYEGDAIIAFFGAPMPMPDHARQACATALDMQSALGDLRNKWKAEGDKWPLIVHDMRMRIGLNSGAITTGNMGSAVRMNYTMMGDAVNLAARLESAAKFYGVYTMISRMTYDLVKDHFEVRLVDKLTVVGKSEPVIVYELMAHKGKLPDERRTMVEMYNEGVRRYFERDFLGAIELLTKTEALEPFREIAPKHMSPSKRILEYCEEFLKNPPGPEWDGVSKLTSK